MARDGQAGKQIARQWPRVERPDRDPVAAVGGLERRQLAGGAFELQPGHRHDGWTTSDEHHGSSRSQSHHELEPAIGLHIEDRFGRAWVDARSQHDAGLGERVGRCLADNSRHNLGVVNHRTEHEPKRIGRSPDIGAGAAEAEGLKKGSNCQFPGVPTAPTSAEDHNGSAEAARLEVVRIRTTNNARAFRMLPPGEGDQGRERSTTGLLDSSWTIRPRRMPLRLMRAEDCCAFVKDSDARRCDRSSVAITTLNGVRSANALSEGHRGCETGDEIGGEVMRRNGRSDEGRRCHPRRDGANNPPTKIATPSRPTTIPRAA